MMVPKFADRCNLVSTTRLPDDGEIETSARSESLEGQEKSSDANRICLDFPFDNRKNRHSHTTETKSSWKEGPDIPDTDAGGRGASHFKRCWHSFLWRAARWTLLPTGAELHRAEYTFGGKSYSMILPKCIMELIEPSAPITYSTSSTTSTSAQDGGKGEVRTWLDGLNSPLIQDEGDKKLLKLRFDVSQYSPEEIITDDIAKTAFFGFRAS
uniref:Uncharacterized protein n=1 Tax=Timema genevievae TaxID=629358 RepID=A0A7R9K3A9_TIMGE|nr:unnamed protein product [Timema genevievae]